MGLMTKHIAGAVLICVAVLLQGCSEIEPRTGTRVSLSTIRKAPSREQTAEICTYLTNRSRQVLGVKRARIDRVTDGTFVLLLPGTKVSRENVDLLVEAASLEFYHLDNVATRRHPNRPWKLKLPASRGAPYIFLGPEGKRIDSGEDPLDFLKEVVKYPEQKPILTGEDVLPTALAKESEAGWSVLARFNKNGAKKLYDFTKNNRGEYLAVFHNGRLVSAPLVGKAISGGEAFITGFKTSAEARSAADQVNSGVLPVKMRIESVDYY